MIIVFNSFIHLLVSISLLLNVDTHGEEDYIFPDYIPGVLDRRLVGPLKYFGDTQSGRAGQVRRKRIKKVRRKDEIYADLVNPDLSVNEVTARLPTKPQRGINTRVGGLCQTSSCFTCLESCKWLKMSKYSTLDITQYTYLRLCSEGCKENL